MPCSPLLPSVAITIDVLELYRVANLRSPRLSIQAFVKTLSDLHGVSEDQIYCLSTTNQGIRYRTVDISTANFPSHSTSTFPFVWLYIIVYKLLLVAMAQTGGYATH